MDFISSRFDFMVTSHFSLKAFWWLDLSMSKKKKKTTDKSLWITDICFAHLSYKLYFQPSKMQSIHLSIALVFHFCGKIEKNKVLICEKATTGKIKCFKSLKKTRRGQIEGARISQLKTQSLYYNLVTS